MSTKFQALFAALASPFESDEVKTRSQGNRQLYYVTARTVMNRLDNVLGPENWWAEYSPFVEHSVRCRLSLRLPDGTVVTKEGIGGFADMADQGDGDKSGASDALKRAGVEVGIARYLYRDGVPHYVGEMAEPPRSAHASSAPPNGHSQRDDDHARPAPRRESEPQGERSSNSGNGNGNGRQGPPRTGKALFAWTKEMEQKHEVSLLKYLNNWSKLQDFPGRMVEWDAEQVSLAYTEACRKLDAVKRGHTEALEDALSN